MNTCERKGDRCEGPGHRARRNDSWPFTVRFTISIGVGRHFHRAANYRLLRNRSFETWQQLRCVY